MKVIFLDVEGVLNNEELILQSRDTRALSPFSLKLLARLVAETEAKIVLSSSWRVNMDNVGSGYDRVLAPALYGFGLKVFDRTEVLYGSRGEEIQLYLDTHEVENYVILDDDNDFEPHMLPHFVQTTFKKGFLEEHFEKALEILSK